MKFKVLNEFENPLLGRKQYTVEINDVKITPNRLEVLKQFSAKMGLDNKTLIIDTIYSEFGTEVAKAYIKSYKDVKTLQKVEVKNNIEKWKKTQETLNPKKEEPVKEKKSEKPKEEPKEEKKETPVEEKKEEPKEKETKPEEKKKDEKKEDKKE